MIRSVPARLVLVSALIAGLLGMHALVVAQPGHSTHAATTAVVEHAAPRTGPVAVEPPVHAAPMPVATSGSAFATSGPTESQHPGGPGGPGGHRVLHLCLVVLAGLLLLITTRGLVLRLGSVGAAAVWFRIGCGRRRPPARPPPISVRLAQLRVLRT